LQAYCPYRNASLVRTWQETKDKSFFGQLDELIANIETFARELPPLVAEGNRKAAEFQRQKDAEMLEYQRRREAERQEYLRKKEVENRARSVQESRQGIDDLVSAWAKERARLQFLEEFELSLVDLPDRERNLALERLAEAKKLLVMTSAKELIMRWKTPDERFKEYGPL
jgi:hypothetical protein